MSVEPGAGGGAEGADHHLDEMVEHGLDEHHLEELAATEGVEALRVPVEILEEELHRKSGKRRALEMAGSLAIVVAIFAFAIPTIGVEYGQVWAQFGELGAREVGVLVAVWLTTMWLYSGIIRHALPGTTHLQGMVLNFSGSAIANVVPFGGAAGIGATYAQCLSWGYDAPSITLYVIVSGVWNVFSKLGFPIVTLALLVAAGRATGGLAVATAVGAGVLSVAIVGLALVFRSDRLALAVGRVAERSIAFVARPLRRRPATGLADAVLDFRHRTAGLVRRHWFGLSAWMIGYKIGQFALLLGCTRSLGIGQGKVGWIEIFAAYTLSELLTTIPFTPSGVGFVEAGTAAVLAASGASVDEAAAVAFLYRSFTYVLEVPMGAVGWLLWSSVHRWRKPPGSMARPDQSSWR